MENDGAPIGAPDVPQMETRLGGLQAWRPAGPTGPCENRSSWKTKGTQQPGTGKRQGTEREAARNRQLGRKNVPKMSPPYEVIFRETVPSRRVCVCMSQSFTMYFNQFHSSCTATPHDIYSCYSAPPHSSPTEAPQKPPEKV